MDDWKLSARAVVKLNKDCDMSVIGVIYENHQHSPTVLPATTTENTEDARRYKTALTDGSPVHTAASSVLEVSQIENRPRSPRVKQERSSLENPSEIENHVENSRSSSPRQTRVVPEHVPMRTRGRQLNQGSGSHLNNRSLKVHKRTQDGQKQNLSTACDKRVTLRESSTAHGKRNAGEPRYCGHCGKRYSSRNTLCAHMNTHTTKYMCKKCGIRCQSSNALEVHKRSHSGKKPFKCTVCKKRFITSSHLVQHNRIHSGEKPFKCQMCDKVFMQSGERNNHMLLHTGEKPHKCSLCDKSFRLTTTLQSHMDRIHTNSRLHQCPFCGKKFKMNHDLKQHVRIHTDTRRHSCRHCSERFLWSIQLKKHLLEAHREGTWIICNFCRTKFVSRSDLNRHVRRHH